MGKRQQRRWRKRSPTFLHRNVERGSPLHEKQYGGRNQCYVGRDIQTGLPPSPDLLLGTFYSCLKDGKKERRPLCMLDTPGGVFEKLIRSRLATGDLSPKQFTFKAGRFTMDTVMQVPDLDGQYSSSGARNCFNSVRWKDMLSTLESSFDVASHLLRVLRDHLENCSFLCERGRSGSARRRGMKTTS